MKIQTKKFVEKTQGHCDIIDITDKIQEQIQKEKIQSGLATLFVPGSTAALTTIEYEAGLVKDLDRKSTRLNSSHIQKSRMPSSA